MSLGVFTKAVLWSSLGWLGAPAIAAAFAPLDHGARRPAALIFVEAPADPIGTHAAIEQAKERLTEIDATLSIIEQEAGQLASDQRQRVAEGLAKLRAIRDDYRQAIDRIAADARAMTAAERNQALAALAASWAAFEQTLDQNVAAIKLNAEQRKAVIAARIAAEQRYWQQSITELQSAATSIAAEKRAVIEARIGKLQARVDEARARLSKLEQAREGAWSALRQGLINSRQIFNDTYGAVQSEIDKATQ